ncbi:MAG TPA: vitamin K epoxide reductase family protein [Gemmatimonadales bacterium]|jgi:uncharacterized membrane protein
MRHRQLIAVLALLGLLLSLYLTLYHYGLAGTLACGGTNQCEKVQASRYAELFGMPVAAYGITGYLALLIISLMGLNEKWDGRREPTLQLAIVSGAGVAFTAYLTWLELFRIHAICRWCVASACIILAIFLASLVSLPSLRTRPSASPQP